MNRAQQCHKSSSSPLPGHLPRIARPAESLPWILVLHGGGGVCRPSRVPFFHFSPLERQRCTEGALFLGIPPPPSPSQESFLIFPRHLSWTRVSAARYLMVELARAWQQAKNAPLATQQRKSLVRRDRPLVLRSVRNPVSVDGLKIARRTPLRCVDLSGGLL